MGTLRPPPGGPGLPRRNAARAAPGRAGVDIGKGIHPAQASLERIRRVLARDASRSLQDLARRHGLSLLQVVRCLPEGSVREAPGAATVPALQAIAGWGEVVTLIHGRREVTRRQGPLGIAWPGLAEQVDNGKAFIGPDRRECATIAFVARPAGGRPSASVEFFDADGDWGVRILVRRGAHGSLDAEQMQAFLDLAERLAQWPRGEC